MSPFPTALASGLKAVTIIGTAAAAIMARESSRLICARPTSTEIGELIWLVNADGSMALLPLHRKQELLAMTPVTFDGAARAVAVNAENEVWLGIERTISGTANVYLEKWDADLLLDAAVAADNAEDDLERIRQGEDGLLPTSVNARERTIRDLVAAVRAGGAL